MSDDTFPAKTSRLPSLVISVIVTGPCRIGNCSRIAATLS
jgi:hypothetical protein